MTIQVGDVATAGDKELSKDWPSEVGLIGGTTKQEGTEPYLEPEINNVPTRDRVESRA